MQEREREKKELNVNASVKIARFKTAANKKHPTQSRLPEVEAKAQRHTHTRTNTFIPKRVRIKFSLKCK